MYQWRLFAPLGLGLSVPASYAAQAQKRHILPLPRGHEAARPIPRDRSAR